MKTNIPLQHFGLVTLLSLGLSVPQKGSNAPSELFGKGEGKFVNLGGGRGVGNHGCPHEARAAIVGKCLVFHAFKARGRESPRDFCHAPTVVPSTTNKAYWAPHRAAWPLTACRYL